MHKLALVSIFALMGTATAQSSTPNNQGTFPALAVVGDAVRTGTGDRPEIRRVDRALEQGDRSLTGTG